jgi:hypothetical protein
VKVLAEDVARAAAHPSIRWLDEQTRNDIKPLDTGVHPKLAVSLCLLHHRFQLGLKTEYFAWLSHFYARRRERKR